MAGFLLWLPITSIMIEVFKVAFSAIAIILSMDMIYSTMEGIVPSHCRLTTQHLGANVKSLFDQRIEDPTHPIVMSRPLGATNCFWQQF